MKAVCPTCGYENQAAGHAVCGRCATIIEVRAPALAAAAGGGAVRYTAAGPPGRWLDGEALDIPEAAPGSSEASDPEPVFDEEVFAADAPETRATSRDESYIFLPAAAPSPLGSLGSFIGGQSWAALLFIAVIVLGGLTFHFQVRGLIVGRGNQEGSRGDRPSPLARQAPVEKAETAETGARVEPAKKAEPSQPSPEPITLPAPAAPEPRREEALRATKHVAEPAPSNQAFVRDRGKGNITLQVGAYVKLAHASERAAQLQSAGVRARVVKAEVRGQRVHYRIVAGRFTSSDEAKRYGQQLRAKGAVRDFLVTNL